MSIRIDVAGGPLSVDASLRPACLHVNEAAAAALGVQARRLAATIDCTDCALVDFELVAKQHPSRPELNWFIDDLTHTFADEWVLVMSRGSDNFIVTGSGPTIAAVVRSATKHLQEVAYKILVDAPKTWHDHHFNAVCHYCHKYGCGAETR
jgi:hypothetical protein